MAQVNSSLWQNEKNPELHKVPSCIVWWFHMTEKISNGSDWDHHKQEGSGNPQGFLVGAKYFSAEKYFIK